MRLVKINELKSANELRARQDEARRRTDLGAPVAIKRFEELDRVESLEMSKCEMESVVARALVTKRDARIDLLTKELESQRAQFELAAVGAKIEMATVQQRMLATISDVSTWSRRPRQHLVASVIDPTWVLPPGARASMLYSFFLVHTHVFRLCADSS